MAANLRSRALKKTPALQAMAFHISNPFAPELIFETREYFERSLLQSYIIWWIASLFLFWRTVPRSAPNPFGTCSVRDYLNLTRLCMGLFIRTLQQNPKKPCRLEYSFWIGIRDGRERVYCCRENALTRQTFCNGWWRSRVLWIARFEIWRALVQILLLTAACLDLFSVAPSSTPLPRCVNSRLVSLPPLCMIYLHYVVIYLVSLIRTTMLNSFDTLIKL